MSSDPTHKTPRATRASTKGVAKIPERAEATPSGKLPMPSGKPRVIVQPASEIKSRKQKFLWAGRIPLGVLALLAGRGGVGKSTFAIWLLVQAQLGKLPGDLLGEPISVLYVSVEDDWETQMVPRLKAAGANLDSFYRLAIGYKLNKETGERIPSLPEDTPHIAEAIKRTGARVVVLDPITSSISGDDHKRDVVRAVLDPIAKVAAKSGAVVLGIMHFNKGAGVASDKLSGSHAYRDAARAVLLFAENEDTGTVVMSQDKGNYSESQEMSIEYRLVDSAVLLDDGEMSHVPRVEILGETHTSVSQLINRPVTSDEVVLWLNDFMSMMGGRALAVEAVDAGKQMGYSESRLNRAKRSCRPPVKSQKDGVGAWYWVSEGSEGAAEGVAETTEDFVSQPSDAFAKPSATRTIHRQTPPRDTQKL